METGSRLFSTRVKYRYKLHVTESTAVPVEQVSFFLKSNNNKKPFVDVLNQTQEDYTQSWNCKRANYLQANHQCCVFTDFKLRLVAVCGTALMSSKDQFREVGIKKKIKTPSIFVKNTDFFRAAAPPAHVFMSVVKSRNDDAVVSNYIIRHLRYHLMCR